MDDHELQKVTAGFPSGWYERQDKEGKIVLTKTQRTFVLLFLVL